MVCFLKQVVDVLLINFGNNFLTGFIQGLINFKEIKDIFPE